MENAYLNREQTEAKHYILKNYLRTMANKIFEGGFDSLAYIDGFSGPWKSATEDYSDTSFMIALRELQAVVDQYLQRGKSKKIRCFFVEENKTAFQEMQQAVSLKCERKMGALKILSPRFKFFQKTISHSPLSILRDGRGTHWTK
jgi:three-Cys-motif partner protein